VQATVNVRIGMNFANAQIDSDLWYKFFKVMSLLNSYNFNVTAHRNSWINGKFELDEYDDKYNELVSSKEIIHYYYVQDRVPLSVSVKFVSILYAELRKYKDQEARKEAEEVINYIVKVATNAFPDERFMILRMAILAFRDEEGRVMDKEKNRNKKWKMFIRKIFYAVDCPKDVAELIKAAEKKTGDFIMDTRKRPNMGALGEFGKRNKMDGERETTVP
jgi:hypothetical protein